MSESDYDARIEYVKSLPREVVAESVAAWWAGLLNSSEKFDNGTAMTKALAVVSGAAQNVEDSKNTAFKTALKRLILENFDTRSTRFLGVDYHPDAFLSSALKEAGIEEFGALPIKTGSWPRLLRGRIGYGGKEEDIPVVTVEVSNDQ